jgi:exodeoxyribonuclease VII small subunit
MSKVKTIKELLAEFEEVARWFDEGELDVEEALKQYKKGQKLAEEIQKRLEEAKNQIKVVN